MRKNSGFTLLEAIVILTVLIIVSAIAAPGAVSWSNDVRLRAAADRFGNDLHKAKTRAVNDGKTVIVTLTPRHYHIFVDRGNGFGGPPNGTYDDDEPVVCQRQLPRSFLLKLSSPASSTSIPPTVAADHPIEFEAPSADGDDHHNAEVGLALGLLAPANRQGRLRFDNIGRCLDPQKIVLENSRGQKRLVVINALGNVKVTKRDIFSEN